MGDHRHSHCALLDQRPAVARVGGFALCAVHVALCEAIVSDDGRAARRRQARINRSGRSIQVREITCYCGTVFLFQVRQGNPPKWCPSCRRYQYADRVRRLRRRTA